MQKSHTHPKKVNPRDTAGSTEEEKEEASRFDVKQPARK